MAETADAAVANDRPPIENSSGGLLPLRWISRPHSAATAGLCSAFLQKSAPGQVRSSRFAVARALPFREFRTANSEWQSAPCIEPANAMRPVNGC
jgi:hypothetical protein